MTWLAYSHLGVAKRLTLDTQPGGALAGIPFVSQPVGRLLDGSGVLSRTTGTVVTVSKLSGVGTLSGTLTAVTVEGVFTFTDLKMDTVTGTVVLQFNAPGLVSVDSNSFNVTQPNTILGAEVGSYTVIGTDIAVSRTRVCQCTSGSYLVTGVAASLTSGSPSAWLEDDFSAYADTTALQGASWLSDGSYGFWGDLSGMSLDTTEGYGTSTRCMKATWAIGDRHMGVYLTLPSSTTEYWTEIWAKVSTTFQTTGTPGDGNPDYKFVFWMLGDGVSAGAGRCQIKLGEYGPMDRLETRYDLGPSDLFITAAQSLASGEWHRYRAHLKLSPSSTSVFNVEFWDGTHAPQQYLQENVDLDRFSYSSYMQIGAYMNQFATQAMNIRWGKITLYNQNPGWGI